MPSLLNLLPMLTDHKLTLLSVLYYVELKSSLRLLRMRDTCHKP